MNQNSIIHTYMCNKKLFYLRTTLTKGRGCYCYMYYLHYFFFYSFCELFFASNCVNGHPSSTRFQEIPYQSLGISCLHKVMSGNNKNRRGNHIRPEIRPTNNIARLLIITIIFPIIFSEINRKIPTGVHNTHIHHTAANTLPWLLYKKITRVSLFSSSSLYCSIQDT